MKYNNSEKSEENLNEVVVDESKKEDFQINKSLIFGVLGIILMFFFKNVNYKASINGFF